MGLTLLVPVLFGFVWAGMGAALYHFGNTAAQAAAQTGATAAAAQHGTNADCEQAAAGFTAGLGDALSDITVSCRRTATTATATITGTTLSLIPGWAPTVTQTVTVAVERIT
ncbi:MAG: pilus assembly protein [Actinobacteria bacterium]|nr:pilus assembly protein [Actinomycetota bacterium]